MRVTNAKQKHLEGTKSVRPIIINIRSSLVNRYAWPKTFMSAEAKKSLIKDVILYYLNDNIQSIFSQV